ncbi:myotubularin-related protein 9 [Venturia canescens]|uniref:myotubularin-related protein 9 n=1 Tax=Venturia canescens TaxID=32260 RepID=UPI001C9C6BBD|nr:myotubularin-related protein 9 [Venturia canescens]
MVEFSDYISVPRLDNVTLWQKRDEKCRDSCLEGTLCLSGHHLLLSSRQDIRKELWLLYRNIDVIEKKTNSHSPGGSITLKLKDFRILQLDINSTDDLSRISTTLEQLSSLDQLSQYPFFFRPRSINNKKDEDGWSAYAPVSEWSKLLALHGDEWRLSHLNRDYKVCNSYPSAIVVPRQIEDQIIVASANFRDGGRFPVLCYRHEGGSILFRSSQPLCGATGKRCREDERLLNAVLGAGRRGYIIDTRSANQAQSARARGGGTEIDAAYPQWRKVYKNVPRLSELADSLYKLTEACSDTACSTGQWLSRLDNSGWLNAVQSALNAACVAAQCLHQESAAVLVHGGTGRDSTLVVTSLAQTILNPDCRTVRGLQALIEREWLQAGHPFYSRTRYGPYHPSHSQNPPHAPTFLLFLDCLYQLNYQFQYSFEYTTELLIKLFKRSYSSDYGTFLGDSEAERLQLKLPERTYSLWSYINQPEILENLLNPLYEPNVGVIWPSVAPVSIELWKELYLTHTNAAPWNGLMGCAKQIKQNNVAVRKAAGQLRGQIKQMLEELISNPESSCGSKNDEEMEEKMRLALLSLESQST